MKNILFKIGSCALWLVIAGGVVAAKPWRGIVPLKSTRVDVERVFGRQQPPSTSPSYYNLSNEIVVFHFQPETCDPFGLGWDVPLDTVINIAVIPKGTHRREEYQLASNSKIDDNGAGFVYYSDAAAGVTVETYKDQVTLVEYGPEATQERLRCPRIQECCYDFFHRFDEYQQLTFADEKARLDNFVIQMKNEFGRGIIEVIGPSRRQREQLMRRAARAKSYLVKQRRIEPERILLVDGGFHEIAVIRLSTYSIGSLGGRIYFFPERDPQDIAPTSRPRP